MGHALEQKIKSLSERLKYLGRNTNSYQTYVDPKVKTENLKYNLSLILANIIINSDYPDRSKDTFIKIISEYNSTNNKNITLKDYEDLFWIRYINNEIVIPRVVGSAIYSISRNLGEQRINDIPDGKEDLVECLQIFQEKSFNNSRLFISKVKLNEVLSKQEVNLNYLLEKGVITFDSDKDVYSWLGGEYSRHLRNEIAATIWIKIGGDGATNDNFRKYIKLIIASGIWVDNLGEFLSHTHKKRMIDLILDVLNSEEDLLKSDSEFKKIWLDSVSYSHIGIKNEIPKITLNFENTFDYIEDVTFHKWRYREVFDYQGSRSIFLLLLRLLVHNDSKSTYENIINIIKDTSKPYLVWSLYQAIPNEYPEIIPHLLLDSELNPLAFKLIDKLSIDTNFLSEQANRDKQFEEKCQMINDIWLEMFDITLEKFSIVDAESKEFGEIICKILFDIAQKTFNINSSTKDNITLHNSHRKRYDEILKKISNSRLERSSVNSYSYITPKLLYYLTPNICESLKDIYSRQKGYYVEFLKINTPFIDIAVEILKLLNTKYSDSEIPARQKSKLEKASTELTVLLKDHIIEYFSVIEIEVNVYDSAIPEKRKARRGVNEFGIEIIDWGILYMHFQKMNLISSIDESFRDSLIFNENEDEYDEQNKEQSEKIKIYTKTLMLAYITISKKIDIYEMDSMPAKATLSKLEDLIEYYSLNYSFNDLKNKSIDIFDERFSYISYDIYHQSMTSLLYRCINLLLKETKTNFVKTFFKKSIDTGRMLKAINVLDSKELQSIISQRLSEVKVEDFIKSTFSVTELESALIEAINSETHWQLAEPLINRVQQHFNKSQHYPENAKNLLFEINLLLAFKMKDLEKLKGIEIPKEEGYYNSINEEKNNNTKAFYTALFNIYNNKSYSEAIITLESLLSKYPKNIRYAFQLYRARTLKAMSHE